MLEWRNLTTVLALHPSRCAKCQQPVTLHVLEGLFIGVRRPVPWVCPHCRAPNTSEIEGRLGYVSRGQPDPDPERPPDSMEIPAHVLQTYARCPQCSLPLGKIVRSISEQAWVFYYRCKSCGHVWTAPKTRESQGP